MTETLGDIVAGTAKYSPPCRTSSRLDRDSRSVKLIFGGLVPIVDALGERIDKLMTIR